MSIESKLIIRSHYWDDAKAKAAFKKFILNIHGLDFTEWDTLGFWDPTFTPFSYFEGDRVVSSVCVYPLRAIIDGKETKLLQISSVGTHPDFRRRGLNKKLTEAGLAWAEGKHEGVFLFSDDEAIPYYERQGFKLIDEFIHVCRPMPTPFRQGAVRLDPENTNDLKRIQGFVENSIPISSKLSTINPRLVMFHVLYFMRDAVFEIPDLDCLVFFKRKDGKLSIYDIIGSQIPVFDDLYPYLADGTDRLVEFHFHTDQLDLTDVKEKLIKGNNTMVKPGFPIRDPVFPYTSRA